MKTIKMFVVIAAMAITTISTATERPTLNVIKVEGEKVLVAYSNQETAQVALTISDDKGRIVYYKATSKPINDFRAMYDLTNLEKGLYTFQMKVNGTRISRNVNLYENAISIGEPVLSLAPVFTVKDGFMDITYLNKSQENIQIKIYRGYEMVFDSGLGDEFVIQNRYNVAKLPSGSYRFILETETDAYTYFAEL